MDAQTLIRLDDIAYAQLVVQCALQRLVDGSATPEDVPAWYAYVHHTLARIVDVQIVATALGTRWQAYQHMCPLLIGLAQVVQIQYSNAARLVVSVGQPLDKMRQWSRLIAVREVEVISWAGVGVCVCV